MKYFGLMTDGVILEAPCNKWTFSHFKQEVKEWVDGTGDPAKIFIGKTWEGREYVCTIR